MAFSPDIRARCANVDGLSDRIAERDEFILLIEGGNTDPVIMRKASRINSCKHATIFAFSVIIVSSAVSTSILGDGYDDILCRGLPDGIAGGMVLADLTDRIHVNKVRTVVRRKSEVLRSRRSGHMRAMTVMIGRIIIIGNVIPTVVRTSSSDRIVVFIEAGCSAVPEYAGPSNR